MSESWLFKDGKPLQGLHVAGGPVPEGEFDGPPTPLTDAARPAFPLKALPSRLGAYVAAVAEQTQTPPGLAGGLVLAVVAGALARRVEVQRSADWYEPANLFTATALESGERKSAVHRHVLRPVYEVERERGEALEPLIRQRMAQHEVAMAAAKAKVRKASTGGLPESEAVEALEAAEAVDVPSVPRHVADDVTPEQFVAMLAANDERLIVASAEGGFLKSFGRYQRDGQALLDPIKKAHSGDYISMDRKHSPPVRVPHPAATLALAIQPSVIADIAKRDGYRSEGLLARFLWQLPVSRVGGRQINPPAVPDALTTGWRALVRELFGIEAALDEKPRLLRLAPEAGDLFDAHRAMLEPRLAGDLAGIADWANKLPGQVLRIAAVLHMAEHGKAGLERAIAPLTMQAALRLGDYFLAHAQAVFGLMGPDTGTATAKRVLAWAEKHSRDRFTERELFQALKHGSITTTSDLAPALELLEAHGWVSPRRIWVAPTSNAATSQGRYINPAASWLGGDGGASAVGVNAQHVGGDVGDEGGNAEVTPPTTTPVERPPTATTPAVVEPGESPPIPPTLGVDDAWAQAAAEPLELPGMPSHGDAHTRSALTSDDPTKPE
jgi:replicative DNA helicase